MLEALVARGVPRVRLNASALAGPAAGTEDLVSFVPREAGVHGKHVTEDVLEIFRRYDRDSSGDIDQAELFAALSDLGLEKVTHHRAGEILARYDKDRSGVLEIDEFAKLVAELRHHMAQSKVVAPSTAELPCGSLPSRRDVRAPRARGRHVGRGACADPRRAV